jgi:hypothetical protein
MRDRQLQCNSSRPAMLGFADRRTREALRDRAGIAPAACVSKTPPADPKDFPRGCERQGKVIRETAVEDGDGRECVPKDQAAKR